MEQYFCTDLEFKHMMDKTPMIRYTVASLGHLLTPCSEGSTSLGMSIKYYEKAKALVNNNMLDPTLVSVYALVLLSVNAFRISNLPRPIQIQGISLLYRISSEYGHGYGIE